MFEHQCQEKDNKDEDEHDSNKFLPFFDGQRAADVAAQDVGQGDGDADGIYHLVGQDKSHEGADIGCQVENLGDGGGIDQVQAQEGIKTEDQKRPCSRPEETVIKADHKA